MAKDRKPDRREKLYKDERFGRLAKFADGVVSAVSPGRGLKRMQARAMASSGHDIVSGGRTRRIHMGTDGSADKMLTSPGLKRLRETSRHHRTNSCVMEAMIGRSLDNILGADLEFDPTTKDKGWNAAAKDYIRLRQAGADVRGLMTYNDMRRAVLGSVFVDGDIVLAHTNSDSLQGFEADQLVTPRTKAKRKVVSGVEVGAKGQARGYWVADRKYGGYVDTLRKARFIRAADAMFPGNRDRLSQTRGKPVLASSMDFFDRVDGYMDSESLAAWINSCLAIWILENEQTAAARGTARAGETEESNAAGGTDFLQKVDRGIVLTLGPGEEAGAFESKRPGDNFGTYLKTSFTLIGASIGLPLVLLLLDFSEVNYSAARAALAEAKKAFRRWQKFMTDYVDMPVYRRWIGQGIARNILTPREDAYAVRFRPPGWSYLDPVKEVVGDREAVKGTFKSPQEIVAARGRSYPEVLAEIAEAKKMADDLGISTSLWTELEAKSLIEPDRKEKSK